MNEEEWSAAVRSFAQLQREQSSIPDRDSLSTEEEWQCRIIGGEFISWYQHRLPDILRQRAALRFMKFDPKPFIIFTTSMPGLVAAREIMPEAPQSLVYLLHSEFEEFERNHLAGDFTACIHHWSYFRPLDEEFLARAQQSFPGVKAEEYRIHTVGDLWGERCGGEDNHLWRWNGREMELLEELFSQVVF